MTYQPAVLRQPVIRMLAPVCRQRAMRRLYREHEARRQAGQSDLAWIGFLLCLAGGFFEMTLVRWLLR